MVATNLLGTDISVNLGIPFIQVILCQLLIVEVLTYSDLPVARGQIIAPAIPAFLTSEWVTYYQNHYHIGIDFKRQAKITFSFVILWEFTDELFRDYIIYLNQ